MVPTSHSWSRILFVASLVVLVAGTASAQGANLTIDSKDEALWLNNDDATVNGEYSCSGGQVTVESPGGSTANPNYLGNKEFEFPFRESTFSEYGTYLVKLDCSGNTDTTSFEVKELKVTRLEPTQDIEKYSGERFTVALNATDGQNQVVLDNQDTEFDIRFLGGKQLAHGLPSYSNGVVSFPVEIPKDTDPGNKRLVTGVEYTSQSGEVIETNSQNAGDVRVKVKRAFQARLLNRTPATGEIAYKDLKQDLSSMSARTKVTKKGQPQNTLAPSDFYVKVLDEDGDRVKGGEWLDSNPGQEDGVYNLQLRDLPSLKYGEYTFELGVDRDGGTPITNFTVFRYVTLSGKLLDASGQPVKASITAEREGLTHSFDFNKGGEYVGNLLPGVYNFTLHFPQADVSVDGVEMKGGLAGSIKYDEVPTKSLNQLQGEGIIVLNGVAVVFGYPFDDASINLRYNPGDANFQNVRVLECENWNFRNRECFEEFEEIDLSRNQISPTTGMIQVPMNPVNVSDKKKILMNAYMVVRNTDLEPQGIEVDAGRIPVGQNFEVSGNVVQPDGSGVGNVKLTISILDEGELVKQRNISTQGDGSFSTQVEAPQSAGLYDIELAARKSPYTGFTYSVDQQLDTYVERRLEVQTPDTVEFVPGEESRASFTIINSGQAPVQSAKLAVRGLNNDWYTWDTNTWDRIPPGSSRTATMTVTLPDGYCEERCREYPTFDVEAVGQSGGNALNDIVTVRSVVTKDDTQQVNATQEQPSDDGGFPGSEIPQATGEFLASQSSLNIALGLIVVFTMVLAGAIKKKKSGGSGGRGGGRGGRPTSGGGRSGGRSQVQRPEVSSQKPKVNADEEDSGGNDVNSSTGGEESGGSHECSVCGEEFDTESARELHEQAIH